MNQLPRQRLEILLERKWKETGKQAYINKQQHNEQYGPHENDKTFSDEFLQRLISSCLQNLEVG